MFKSGILGKSIKIFFLIVVVVLIILASSMLITTKPEHYISETQAADLERDDEVIIENQSFIFQSSRDVPEDESKIKLIFLDSNLWPVTITTERTTLLNVKRSLPWWMPTPVPPPPSPVPVPVPIPVPTPPNVTPPIPPNVTPPTPPTTTTIQPLPPGSVCGNGIIETGEQCEPPNTATCDANCQTIPTPTYPPTCYDNTWNVDESDMDCGGSCPQCLSTGIYTSCWDNSDCASGNCDISGAQRPLPPGYTIQTLRQLAGQGWIIPYQGICR